MKPGLALLNALCGTKTNGPFLATCRGGYHGRSPEDVKDAPFGASKAQKKKQRSQNEGPKTKMKENESPKRQNERNQDPERQNERK